MSHLGPVRCSNSKLRMNLNNSFEMIQYILAQMLLLNITGVKLLLFTRNMNLLFKMESSIFHFDNNFFFFKTQNINMLMRRKNYQFNKIYLRWQNKMFLSLTMFCFLKFSKSHFPFDSNIVLFNTDHYTKTKSHFFFRLNFVDNLILKFLKLW